LFEICFRYAIRKVQVNQVWPEIKWYIPSLWLMLMMLIYWAESIQPLQKITEALAVASKEISTEKRSPATGSVWPRGFQEV
jgi:hypothetical protein